MESPLTTPIVFPTVPKNDNKKGHIPIRSITYKKALAKGDIEAKKEMLNTMSRFNLNTAQSGSASITSPGRPSTHYDSKPATASHNPYMSQTFHKLSLGSPKESPRKFQSNLLPNLKSARPSQVQSRPALHNYAEHHNMLQRSKTKDVISQVTPQEDYFKLLFDENRKPFKVEDYEGVDEFYTKDMVMTRIYNQGFRDPEYFSTKKDFLELRVPDEKTIRDEYRFKIPPIVSTMENNETLAAHLLGGTLNNIGYVESVLESAQNELKGVKEEKKDLEDQIADLNKRFEQELKNIMGEYGKKFEKLQSILSEDFIANQNENFKLQKEIVLLQRDKLNLEKGIETSIPRLVKLEDVLYGKEIFNLEANEEGLNQISSMNLRPALQNTMKNRKLVH